MTELWLNFKDENGEAKRVLVEGEKFAIGRTSDNDLPIPISNLSRQHAKIERFADVYVVSDCGSSNGSTLNGEKLEKPIGLKKGDILNLGEAVEIEVELISDEDEDEDEKGGAGAGNAGDDDEGEGSSASSGSSASAQGESASSSSGGGSMIFFILAPIFGVFLILLVGGVFLIARGKQEPEIVKGNNDFISTRNDDDDDDSPTNSKNDNTEKTETPTPVVNSGWEPGETSTTSGNTNSGGTSSGSSTSGTSSSIGPVAEDSPIKKTSSDTEKIESSSANFLRRIAQNDTRAFLTGKQISVLNGKINQFKGSGALAENIQNAKKSASQIASMAQSKNFKPQFLAGAALAKLGNSRGDVVATAQSMLDTLDNLSIVLGNELADDNLLVMAAFDQGVAGENLKMRDKVAGLTKKFPNKSSREIRTIWFLKDNGEITDAQFEFALRFLAIGTIAQNPKDFNVQAEAISF